MKEPAPAPAVGGCAAPLGKRRRAAGWYASTAVFFFFFFFSLSLSLSPIPSHKARTRESSEVGGCSALLCCDQLEIFSTDVKIETKQQSALLMFPPSKRKENQAVKLLFFFFLYLSFLSY
jgi:hypothetical protein